MAAFSCLILTAFAQGQAFLEVGEPIEGIIGADAAVVNTPTLDANYTKAPPVGNEFQFVVSESGTYTIELISYDFDAYLVVTDSTGALIAEDDDGLISTHARVVLADHDAGDVCHVQACALPGGAGKFRLHLTAGAPAPMSAQEHSEAEIVDEKARLAYIAKNFGKETARYATAQNQLGIFLLNQGSFENAQVQWESALAIREKILGPNHIDTLASINNLGVLYFYQGRYEQARPFYERSLSIRLEIFGPDDPKTAAGLNNLAGLLYSEGNYKEARPLFEKALAIREKVLGPEDPNTADVMSNLALLLRSEGDYEQARPLAERTLKICEKVFGEKHPSTALSMHHLGQLLHYQGDLEGARSLYEHSLLIWAEVYGPEHPDVALGQNSLAALWFSQGNLEKSRSLYERSLAIMEKVNGAEHPETATALLNLASNFQAEGKFGEARPLYERALMIHEKVNGQEHPATADALGSLAINLNSQGDYKEASRLLERSIATLERVLGNEHPDTSRQVNRLARLLQSQGLLEEALPLFLQALTGSLDHLDLELPSMSEAGRLQFLAITANPEYFLSCLSEADSPDLLAAYSTFQNWKGKATRLQAASVKLGQLGNTPGIRKKRGRIQVIAKQLSAAVLLPSAEQANDHVEFISSLKEERLKLERELNRELGLDQSLATPSLPEIREGLPKGSVLVDFFVGKNVYVWVVKDSGDPELFSLGSRDELPSVQIAFLSAATVRGGRSISTGNTNVNEKLLALLWEPLRQAIGDAETVFVSPDGFLCELPFGILKDSDGRFLLEKHRFIYLSDPTRLANASGADSKEHGSLFVVGGVNYSERGEAPEFTLSRSSTRSKVGGSWSSLPATRDEAHFVSAFHDGRKDWRGRVTVVGGTAATEERIRAELPGKRYVHIATHGYFEPEHLPSLLLDAEEKHSNAKLGEQIQAVGLLPGLLSGLVFAGVNGEPDPTRDDGYLSAEEIQHLDLSACDLVVLSACETALGSARAGEGLMSLRRSFSVAGADTVISSLWKVDDQATAQLMKDFYTNLWEKGMSRVEALHEAKLRMLRRNRIDKGGDAMPSTWGAFVLSGNWN